LPQVDSILTQFSASTGTTAHARTPSSFVAAPRIAINGRFLTQKLSGVQRFAIETVQAIDALLDSDVYQSLRSRIEIVAPKNARDLSLKNILIRRVGFFSGYAWEQSELPLNTVGQLLLNLCILGPLLTRNQVIVVHDASVRAVPENFARRFRIVYDFLIPRLLARADSIVTVSEFSRREVAKWYGADINKIAVCYEGGEHINAVRADVNALDRFGLRRKKYFLGVGVASNKNNETLIAAFLQAGLCDALLVLTGERSESVHRRFVDVQAKGVRPVGYVSDGELRTLYENAVALIYPSRYEGFGLPPLEAMNCGCPVVISDQPALIEISGGASLQCGVDDIAELARLIKMLHSDLVLRERLKAAGLAHARRFTWHNTAQMFLNHCIRLANQ
jgi:glycosyltransferase involved in cell wall biosynthesis